MTDTPAPVRKPTPTRKPSAKTLARQLARYLNKDESGLSGLSTINDLLESLRSAIVEEEVGDDLNIFGS